MKMAIFSSVERMGIEMAKNSAAKIKANNKHAKEKYEEVKFRVPRGEKEKLKSIACENGSSLNGYIYEAVKHYSNLTSPTAENRPIHIRPMTSEEANLTEHISKAVINHIGCIKADMGFSGNEFWASFQKYPLNSKYAIQFGRVTDSIFKYLRDKRFLSNRSALSHFCASKSVYCYDNKMDYGVRVDCEEFSYLMRLNPRKIVTNMVCYCFYTSDLEGYLKGQPIERTSEHGK